MSIDASHLRISLKEEERWRRRLSVTVPSALVQEEERQAAAKLASRVKLKGFRKGHVPSDVIKSRFGPAVRQETLDRIIGDAYRQALASEDLRPISEGEIEEISYEPEQDLTFEITFDVQPAIEVSRLGGFAVERPALEVGDEQVDKVLERLREQNGAWKPVEEGKPEDGDLAGVRIRKLDEEDDSEREYELLLGEGNAIPDVEDAVKTLAIGETGEFTVTFPEDFPNEDRRGDQERIEVTVLGRKKLDVPELDDDFARQVGDFEGLDDLRAKIAEDLARDAEEQAESAVRSRLVEFLLEANTFEVPRSMVERYVDAVVGDQSKLPEERLEEIRESVRPEAERSVKRLLLVDHIAHTQGLEATEEEIDERIEDIAQKNDSTAAKVYASLQKSGRLETLEREITERKVFDFLKAQSDITDAPAA